MKIIVSIIFGFVACLFVTQSFASSNGTPKSYIGFAFVDGGLDMPVEDSTTMFETVSPDENNTGLGWHVFGGVLREVSDRLSTGVELGFVKPTETTYVIKGDPSEPATGVGYYAVSYLDLLADLQLKLGHNFSLITKLGLASVQQFYELELNSRTINNKVMPEGVFGVAYHLSNKLRFEVTFDKVFASGIDKTEVFTPDKFAAIETLQAGLAYNFD